MKKLNKKAFNVVKNIFKNCDVKIETTMTTEKFISNLERFYENNVDISKRKNADYAGSVDPFKNFRACENLGICSAEKGILVRMTDKLQRITNLLETEAQVKDESIVDTLADLANYSAILAVYIDSKK